MDRKHRETIQKNFAILVQHCNIDILLPALLQKSVFSRDMITKYQTGTNKLENKRDFFLDIQMRGPQAFGKLVAALHETGQHYLANSLDPTSNVAPRRHAVPFQLPSNVDESPLNVEEIRNLGQENAGGTINISTEPTKIDVVGSTRLYDDPKNSNVPIYSTHSKNKGIAFIINNINYNNNLQPERKGADVDSRNLRELFFQMGFKVELHNNLTAEDMEKEIRNFKSSPVLNGIDMVFVIIMGHGIEDNHIPEIIGVDNKKVSTKWIEEQFDNIHCKALQKKPKIIIYQTCRGLIPDYGTTAHHIEFDAASSVTIRSCSDMLIAHSTLSGTSSHRDIFLGSWYISLFCENMMNYAYNTHIEDIFKMIDLRLAALRSSSKTMQTSMFTNVGFKTCFVHPKIYMDDGIVKNIHNDAAIDAVV